MLILPVWWETKFLPLMLYIVKAVLSRSVAGEYTVFTL